MSAPKKKRALATVEEDMARLEQANDDEEETSDFGDDEDLNDEESEGESEEEIPNQNVQVEFEARIPEDHDFHGIRKLLQQLFLKANVNLSELTDTIISQSYIGSVIRQSEVSEEEDDDEDDIQDIFGIVSVINLTERKNLDTVKQIKGMLLDRCKECASGEQAKLAGILQDESSHVGLLINERFLNIPPQIALPSFENLWKEVDRAKKKKMKYEFGYYIMISKTYRFAKSGAAKKGPMPVLEDMFANAEEEFFLQEAVLKFEYSVSKERDVAVGGEWGDEEEDLEPTRTVMVIPADRIPAIMAQLGDVLALPT